jgi:hypothetical protein
MFSKLLTALSDGLIAAGQSLKRQTQAEPIQYFPPKPVGEIRPRKHSGKISFFWIYTDANGDRKAKYLARSIEKAEQRREELSGILTQDWRS